MSSSITIHNIHDKLDQKIRQLAKERNTSINKTVKKLLEKQLNISNENARQNNLREFQDLCGVWSEDEFNTFNDKISNLRIWDFDTSASRKILDVGL